MLVYVAALSVPIGAATVSFTVFEQLTSRQLKPDPLLNPGQEILMVPHTIYRHYGIMDLRSEWSPDWRGHLRYRPILDTTPSEYTVTGILDEASVELKMDQTFIYVGKKNIKDGVGLSTNPTDFLGENKWVDKTKRQEDRRTQREGDLVVGVDWFQDSGSYNVIFSPQSDAVRYNRYLMKANLLIESLKTDVSASYFSGLLSGLGLNISTTITDSWVFHVEAAYRDGRSQKTTVRLVKDDVPREYRLELDPAHVSYADIIIGSQLTLSDASTVMMEYYYHGGGYSESEWATLTDWMMYSNHHYKIGLAPDLMRGYLQLANRIIQVGSMRQHYCFFRFYKPNWIENLDVSLVGLSSLNDGGLLLNPYVTYRVNDTIEVYGSGYWFFGSEGSEFGLTNWNPEITVGVKWACF